MLIYLIRHADALDGVDDAARPLSVRGEQQLRVLADFLQRARTFVPDEVWHSPLVRARQTAELLAGYCDLITPLRLMPDLRPEDDPRAVARRLKVNTRSVAVVGHEPHLSALATLLVVGKTEPVSFVMKKGAVLALERSAEHWMARWHVSPGLLA
jgi:phosphohistidine phosphatase